MPPIHPDLIRAYENAIYEINATHRITLKVSEYSHLLEELHKHHQCTTSALITACNPRSQILSAAENETRMLALIEAVEKLGYRHLPAVGRDPNGKWPDEPSLWIAGLTKNEAGNLAHRFEQNGFLWMDKDAVPLLRLLVE
jgi:hypothetical protein